MAKRTINRRELRDQAEAAEKLGVTAETTGKAGAKKEPKKKAAARPKRTKTKVVVRKRLVWGVFSSTLKEEGRYPYGERDAAEARAEELAVRHKRTYFVQPIKEPIADKAPVEDA